MVVHDLYSKRRKRELGEGSDVFTYDSIPVTLRNQVIHIWGDTIGIPYVNPPGDALSADVQGAYHIIASALRREYGVMTLALRGDPDDPSEALNDLIQWLHEETATDRILGGVELSFRFIDHATRDGQYLGRSDASDIADDAIAELNTRFREHGLGYEYTDGQIIRIDSKFIHAEAVIPALGVLRRPEFATAQAEFLSAYEHFRHGKKQETLVDCCKAFESTMKIICDKRGWTYDPRAAAKELVNGLIPPYWQSHFSGLRSVLESAISTPRNKQAGHGAGSNPPPDFPDELVSYVLHMTAATILFLSDSEGKLP